MSKADEKKLEQMLKDFETANPDAGEHFRTLLSDTPALKANLFEAIGKGHLERIEAIPAGMAGAPGGFASKDTTVAGVAVKANTILVATTHRFLLRRKPDIRFISNLSPVSKNWAWNQASSVGKHWTRPPARWQ